MTWGIIGMIACSAWIGFWFGIELRDWQCTQVDEIQNDLDIMEQEYQKRELLHKGQTPLTREETEQIINNLNHN